MTLLAGCASGEAARQTTPAPSATTSAATPAGAPSGALAGTAAAEAARLQAALLPAPEGMRAVHGPETGAFGSLEATRQGLAAARQARPTEPECAGAAQLDATAPALAAAPATVVAYASERGSITQALVSMPEPVFPPPLPRQCATYEADVDGTRISYRTRELDLPKLGQQSRAYLTTSAGGAHGVQVGSVVVRRGRVVMSLLVVGREVEQKALFELARLADAHLAKTVG